MSTRKRKAQEMSGGPPIGRQPLTKRRCLGEIELTSYLAQQITDRAANKPMKANFDDASIKAFKKSRSSVHLLRKEHSLATQALVIFLRFGSLTTDETPWLTGREVFERTGVKISSQSNFIGRWRLKGFTLQKVKRKGGKRKLTEEQIRWITDTNTLQSMSHLPLRHRCHVIREKLGLEKLDIMTLSRYYHRYGI